MPEQAWTHEQFDSMSWHDNHVHAVRIVEGACSAGQLVLDLDYIVEWICSAEGNRFKLVPAGPAVLSEAQYLRPRQRSGG